MFGGMDDDGFYYVRTLGGCHSHLTAPQRGLSQSWGGDEQGFPTTDAWGNGQATSHDRDVDPRLLRGLPGQGGGAEDRFLISVSPVSPPQGELNGQRGLVPSNFLEGPGPEAGSSHREPGTPPTKSQVSEELVWWWGQGGVVGGVQRVMTNEHCAQAGPAEFCQRSPARASALQEAPLQQRGDPQPSCPHPGADAGEGPCGKEPCASTPLAWFQESPTCWISLSPQSLSKPLPSQAASWVLTLRACLFLGWVEYS